MRPRLALFLLLSISCLAFGDEIDSLDVQIKPPARFFRLPTFTVDKRIFTFQHATGPKDEVFWVVRDDSLYVALVGENNGEIFLLGFCPEDLRTTLEMPTGRFHLDSQHGSPISTGLGLGGAKSSPFIFDSGKIELKLTRSIDDAVKTIRHTFTFRLDSIHGYMVDARYNFAYVNPPATQALPNVIAEGIFAPWPSMYKYKKAVFTPFGSTGYQGYFNNSYSIDKFDETVSTKQRDGGFIAFLDDSAGWSSTITRSGGGVSSAHNICNAHNIWGANVVYPRTTLNANNRYELTVHSRLIGLPPEETSHISSAMNTLFTNATSVVIPVGSKEDFENQPLKMDKPVRGLYSTSGLKLTTTQAYSGTKSLQIQKQVWPNLPQVVLEPYTTYRLDAMVKAVGSSTKAYITGKTYEWSPHSNIWFSKLSTDTIKEADGWKAVSFEIETGAWDPFIDIRFYADSGTAYVDDFQFVKVGRTHVLSNVITTKNKNATTFYKLLNIKQGAVVLPYATYDLRGRVSNSKMSSGLHLLKKTR